MIGLGDLLCPPGLHWTGQGCAPAAPCPPGTHWDGQQCVIAAPCPPGLQLVSGTCQPPIPPSHPLVSRMPPPRVRARMHGVGDLSMLPGPVWGLAVLGLAVGVYLLAR